VLRGVVFLAICGCGRLGFDRGVDADHDVDAAGGQADAADAELPCTFGAWGQAINVTMANTNANDWSPSLSDDGLELVWETTVSGNQDLYGAIRQAPSDPFGAASSLDVLNSPQADASPSLSADRRTIYFSSNRTGQWRLYRATRAATTDPFDPPAIVPELANVGILGPAISSSGDEIVYTDLGESTLSRAVATNGTFAVAGAMTELGTTASAYPDLSRDALTIYFDTNSSVLVSATRSAPGAQFSMPSAIPGAMNSGAGEADAELGDRDRQMVFSSNRTGGAGNWDVWLVQRTCD
jgi:Tol biopolymer transport system component